MTAGSAANHQQNTWTTWPVLCHARSQCPDHLPGHRYTFLVPELEVLGYIINSNSTLRSSKHGSRHSLPSPPQLQVMSRKSHCIFSGHGLRSGPISCDQGLINNYKICIILPVVGGHHLEVDISMDVETTGTTHALPSSFQSLEYVALLTQGGLLLADLCFLGCLAWTPQSLGKDLHKAWPGSGPRSMATSGCTLYPSLLLSIV